MKKPCQRVWQPKLEFDSKCIMSNFHNEIMLDLIVDISNSLNATSPLTSFFKPGKVPKVTDGN